MDKKARHQRQEAFDNLPQQVKDRLTPEEKSLFLLSETWPDELFEKLDEFLVKKQADIG
ncbi:MAG TPA: hypothetical protein VK885_00020 [Desulfotignum sp.]|jgi:hypothetical protein|nr:hypothetical protein [Desulfotignum sp.]